MLQTKFQKTAPDRLTKSQNHSVAKYFTDESKNREPYDLEGSGSFRGGFLGTGSCNGLVAKFRTRQGGGGG